MILRTTRHDGYQRSAMVFSIYIEEKNRRIASFVLYYKLVKYDQ